MKDHFQLLATCNQWMNEKLYETAAALVLIDLQKGMAVPRLGVWR
ncbi:MAG: hypothetical protein WEB57_13735 [Pseudohongiellaceae bacterium]